jgi:DNA-binding MarR family transcriptional regulator
MGDISMSRYRASDDAVGRRRAQWRQEQPEIDTRGMAILGRARWISLRVRPAIEAVFAKHGLDSGEFDVLATMLRNGPPYRLRPTELFRSLMVSSGGMTDRLNRLAARGLIERAPSEDDARSLLVVLTAKGQRMARDAFKEDMKVEAELLAALSRTEQEQLAALLAKLALSLEDAASD